MSEPLPLDWAPRVVLTDGETEIVLRSAAPEEGLPDGDYRVTVLPMETGVGRGWTAIAAVAREGVVRVRVPFGAEQEHLLTLARLVEEETVPVGQCRVYAVAEDLYHARPWKGDLHMHSNRSDGRDEPGHVAMACRRIGLDFMALTDHRQYAPSLEAIDAFAGVPVDLRISPGEEIHPPDPACPIHIVNFAGRYSVNALMAAGEPYRSEVRALAETLDDPALSPEQRLWYAQARWAYAQIRAAGGLAIFCHPYWITGDAYNVPEPLIARHFADRPFDAYEVIGGYFLYQVESNLLQVARYYHESARGNPLPIVGVSDAHGCETGELFGWYYTIVFAPQPEVPEVIEAIRARQAVAVEALPGATPRVHGPFRLVKFAQFLLREVFPTHDALCRAEARFMQAHLTGDAAAIDELARLQGQVSRLYARYWGHAVD